MRCGKPRPAALQRAGAPTRSAPPKQRSKPLSAWSPRGHQAVTSGSIMPTEQLTFDLKEIRHTPLPARSPRGHRSVTDVVATLKARVAELETELAQAEKRSRGHRADFEHERERADQLVTAQDRMVAELAALHSLLDAALPRRSPPGPRIWRDREMIRWLNRCAPFWKPRRLLGWKPRSRLPRRSPPEHGAR